MGRHVALLRGINVGGKNKVPMKHLSAVFEAAGCEAVQTYIQSGNVVFSASAATAKRVGAAVTAALEAELGLRVPVVLRSAAAYRSAVAANPFIAAGAPQEELHLAFLSAEPEAARVAKLDPQRSPPDAFEVVGPQVYLRFPKGVGKTKLSNAYLDSTLGVVSTVRNWRTVLALLDLLGA